MRTSKTSPMQTIGELRAAKRSLDSGRLKSGLEGWVMAFKARGMRPGNAFLHDTILAVLGFTEMRFGLSIASEHGASALREWVRTLRYGKSKGECRCDGQDKEWRFADRHSECFDPLY